MARRASGNLLALAIALPMAVGCTAPRSWLDSTLKHAESHVAYQRSACCDLPYDQARHYERGWRSGYYHVCRGASSCPPVTPPGQYWAHKYQCPEGRHLVGLWYEGYRDGAAAAECEGRKACYRVPCMPAACDCTPACCNPQAGLLPTAESTLAAQVSRGGVWAPSPSPSDRPTAAPGINSPAPPADVRETVGKPPVRLPAEGDLEELTPPQN